MSIDADIKQIQDRTDAVESSVREWAENQIRDLEELAVNAAADLQRLAGRSPSSLFHSYLLNFDYTFSNCNFGFV